MKRYFTALSLIAAICVAGSADAQQRTNEAPPTTTAQPNQQGVARGAGAVDDRTSGSNVRVSELIGMNIQNDAGDSVGEVHDLVLDTNTGKIRYAAVTYGGFLGLGDKLFAVPFEAFGVAHREGVVTDGYVLTLNVTQAQLDGAQGFDDDNWPNMADEKWAMDLDRRYGVDRNRRGVGVDVNRNGVDVDVNRN